jgi:hypothetical protein
MNRLAFLLWNALMIFFSKMKPNESKISKSIYSKLSDKNDFILDSSYLITSFESNTKHKCLARCTKENQCVYTIFKQNKCYICKTDFTSFVSYSANGNSIIYQKNSFNPTNGYQATNGLTNYWSFNGNVNDAIGNAHLYGGVNAALTTDRFGVPNSALSLTDGYYKVPAGVYFSGTQLSIMGWVKITRVKIYSRLVDFGNVAGNGGHTIMICISQSNTGKPWFNFQSGTTGLEVFSSTALINDQWQHLAAVNAHPNYYIYIDGIVVGQKYWQATHIISNVTRPSNFIGKSNWNGDANADAVFDDLKIFNRALSQQEIQSEMNNNL